MMDFDIIPFPEEDEVSFVKRKAYYYRMLRPRMAYDKAYEKKLISAAPLSSSDKEEISAFWEGYMPSNAVNQLIDYHYYGIYKRVLRENELLFKYMPDSFYYLFIDDFYTNPQHSIPCDDKNLYDLFFHDINRPKVLFRKMHDMLLDEGYNQISVEDAIAMAREQGEVILKESHFSGSGHGISFWNKATDDESIIRDIIKNPRVICQALIKQHSELSRLNPTSVNTVRIMTLDFHGTIYILSSIMRTGVNGSRVDNCYSGGVFCGIQPNGRLKNVAYDTFANIYTRHPQGTAFESVAVPNYGECIDLVSMLAKRFCSISRLISWDLAIGEDGHPILIEFNVSCGGLDIHQLPNGPIFGDLTEEVLDDVFKNSYTLNSILKSMQ